MSKITITVDVDGSAVSRDYGRETAKVLSPEEWGEQIEDMLDTIEKSAKSF